MTIESADWRGLGLKQLRAYHAIVRTGSVTAAAREVGLSQPSVSRILGQIEALVGFELFYRDRGRLVLTSDGLLLYDEIELALGQVDRVGGLLKDLAEYRTGELKLVAPPSFSESMLPEMAASFLTEYPQIRLSIDMRSVETSKQMIASRVVDGGFLKLPLDRPDLRPEKVVTSETAAVLRRDHPLAVQPALTPRLLRGESLILLGRGRASRQQIEGAFASAGVPPLVRVETHTIGSACALADRGIGIALVNALLAQSYVVDRNAVMLPFRPRLRQDYAFATSALSQPSRLALLFLDHARKCLSAAAP